MKILITGSAGFIGFHLANYLIKKSFQVIGIDNLNSYYDVNLKKSRLSELESSAEKSNGEFKFIKCDLTDRKQLQAVFKNNSPDYVVNLAAQAGCEIQ